jgi:murein DD-endopeptidase MepM/ murein hydrolase activator NlpD
VSIRGAATRAIALAGALALLTVPGLPGISPPASVRSSDLQPAAFVHTGDSDLAAKQKQIEKALATAQATYEAAGTKVQAAAQAYAQASAELPGAQQALADAKGAVIAASVAVDQANAAVTRTQRGVVDADLGLARAEQDVTDTRATITALATRAYESSGLTMVNVMMNPGSPTDVLTRLTLLDQMESTQTTALAGYQSARMTAKDAYNKAAAARAVAGHARTAATTALANSQKATAKAEAAAASVTLLVNDTKAALAVAQQNTSATLAAYQQLQQENAQVTAQLAAEAARDAAAARSKPPATGTRTSVKGTSGYFIMPVHGWESSPFGMRYDPFYKRWQLHAGVDIAAGGGTPIKAAGSGRVIRAGWDGGYGNYTCIDNGIYDGPGQYHGKGIATCYAHQSKILVHVGQQVSTGQTIGLVGETGAAIGYHLHFEVRVNGVPVQPLNWLPACFC